ncbi:MAG: hypothetical protein WCP39_03010 [Chlamydiota bacterium]
MIDPYDKIANSLTDVVELLEELFEEREKKDFLVQEILFELDLILPQAKTIGGKVLEETLLMLSAIQKLVLDSNMDKSQLPVCIQSCVNLKNQLWEL